MWEIVKADLKTASRRVEELAYISISAIAAGALASYAGRLSVYLIALLVTQLATYFYIVRDWDRGVLEGLTYYCSYTEIYLAKLIVVGLISTTVTTAASLFVPAASVADAAAAALLFSSTSSLAALFATYGGLPPPAGTAMALALALPPAVAMAEGNSVLITVAGLTAAIAVGVLTTALLDQRR